MSDKFEFEKEYKRFAEIIEPSEEFRSRLTVALENERRDSGSKKKGKTVFVKIFSVSAAACLVLIVGGVSLFNTSGSVEADSDNVSSSLSDSVSIADRGNDDEDTTAADVQARLADLSSYNASIIDKGKSWYEEGTAASECAKLLSSRLTEDGGLDYLSVSDTSVFTDADKADAEEISRLAEYLSVAEFSSDPDLSYGGEAEYYMAVFSNGDIVKITLYDKKYIVISDVDGVFEIK